MTPKTVASLATAISIIGLIAFSRFIEYTHGSTLLAARLEKIVSVEQHTVVSCAEVAASHPIVLLALGQSNAGNHGSLTARKVEPITLISGGQCIQTTDPLPGGTGRGASIWQRLPALLTMKSNSRPIVISVLAVEASTIEDWTSPPSPLRARLSSHLRLLRCAGLAPSFVLWQQGEADARVGTSTADYLSGLDRLASILDAEGSHVPILLANSTICRSSPGTKIQLAMDAKSIDTATRRFRRGPDTDTLQGPEFRYDGCHLNHKGIESAARMWADIISHEILKL